jgi:pimeloyl-ACP methyl ester carboxylesterase
VKIDRKRMLTIAGAAGAAVLVVVGLVVRNSRKVRRFEYYAAPLSAEGYAQIAARPGWSARPIDVAPGVTLRGIVRRPTRADAPWLLFFGGNGGSVLADAQRTIEAVRGGEDWGAATWAYRGFDSSTGTPGPEALASDAWAVYTRLLEDEKLTPSRVHVVGFSLGTSFAASIAARAASTPPASLTLLAPMTALDIMVGGKYLGDAHRYETTPYLDAITTPTLVVHGSADEALPVDYGRAVAQRLGSRAQYTEIPGVKHAQLVETPEALGAVRAFIKSHAR